MLNLLGCSKDNFKLILKSMNYKIINKDKDVYFRYSPPKKVNKKLNKETIKESPFKVLKNLNLS